MSKKFSAAFDRRTLAVWIGIAAIPLLTSACFDQPSEQPPQTQAAQAEALKQQWNEAVEAVKSYSAEGRNNAIKQAREALSAVDSRIEELEASTHQEWSKLSETVRQHQLTVLQGLHQQRNELAEWYGGMRYSSAESWESVKQGFLKAYRKLAESLDNAKGQGDGDDSGS